MCKEVHITKADLPIGWSPEAAYFINKLIVRKPEWRLGNISINQLKNHAWLRDIPWNLLISKKLKSPFIPKGEDNFNAQAACMPWSDSNPPRVLSAAMQELFKGYHYDHRKIQKMNLDETSTDPTRNLRLV